MKKYKTPIIVALILVLVGLAAFIAYAKDKTTDHGPYTHCWESYSGDDPRFKCNDESAESQLTYSLPIL